MQEARDQAIHQSSGVVELEHIQAATSKLGNSSLSSSKRIPRSLRQQQISRLLPKPTISDTPTTAVVLKRWCAF
jgi:hypothetical protein